MFFLSDQHDQWNVLNPLTYNFGMKNNFKQGGIAPLIINRIESHFSEPLESLGESIICILKTQLNHELNRINSPKNVETNKRKYRGRHHGFLSGGRIVGRVANLPPNKKKTLDLGHFILGSRGNVHL